MNGKGAVMVLNLELRNRNTIEFLGIWERLMNPNFNCAEFDIMLTDTINPRDYIKKMLRRDPELKSKWGTICPPVEMIAPDGLTMEPL